MWHFDGWCPYVSRAIDAIDESQLYRWGLFIRKPLGNWVKGGVALLGDAAHPMLPYMLRDMPVQNEDALGIFSYDPVTAILGGA